MNLIITRYIDTEPVQVAKKLERAVVHGLDAAASRIAAERDDVVTQPVPEGIRVSRGLQILDNSELRVHGESRLTILEFVVPWTTEDRDGAKLLAANAFAETVAGEVAVAA